jgi:putative alpha-1,2-mannosidase
VKLARKTRAAALAACRSAILSAATLAAQPALASPLAPGDGQATLASDPTALVDPFIGTGSGGTVVGPVDMFPGASAPFGMLAWSPDTPSRPASGGYNYGDSSTIGMSLTHASGAGCGIADDVPILPTTGAIGTNPTAATESFSHSSETAVPGSYDTTLGAGFPAIGVSLAATNTGTWKTATATLPDAAMAKAENNQADFRIASGSPVIVHSALATITGTTGVLPVNLCPSAA